MGSWKVRELRNYRQFGIGKKALEGKVMEPMTGHTAVIEPLLPFPFQVSDNQRFCSKHREKQSFSLSTVINNSPCVTMTRHGKDTPARAEFVKSSWVFDPEFEVGFAVNYCTPLRRTVDQSEAQVTGRQDRCPTCRRAHCCCRILGAQMK
jgi:hypothetical protein